jgi:hypothetical protein
VTSDEFLGNWIHEWRLTKTRTWSRHDGRRRVFRGWLTVALGGIALAAPLLIGQWALLFLFALAPMGVFIVVVGVIEIMRGTVQLERESR